MRAWIDLHWSAVRSVLIVAATGLAVLGLIATAALDNWYLGTICWSSAFLCKVFECWLLERALVAAQLDAGEAS